MEAARNATVAALPSKWATAFDNEAPTWTRRELLSLPYRVAPGATQLSVPFFMPNSDLEHVLFTDTKGSVLRYTEDQVYEAMDHKLVWIDSARREWGEEEATGDWKSGEWQESIYLYTGLENHDVSQGAPCLEAQAAHPSEIFLFTDYFSESTAESPHANWERIFRIGEDAEYSASYVSVGPLPESRVDDGERTNHGNAISETLHKYTGQALAINPSIGHIVLRHTTVDPLISRVGGCLHLRAYFFDNLRADLRMRTIGRPSAHWMGISCKYGSAAIGLSGEILESYAVLNGICPSGSPAEPTQNWQITNVLRSEGWHLFDLYLEANIVLMMIDGEIVYEGPSNGQNDEQEEILLVGRRGQVCHWSAVELLHTPPGCVFQSRQSQAIHGRHPWQVESDHHGRWQVLDGRLQGDVDPPPTVSFAAEPPPIRVETEERPSTAGALTIECWSIPNEAELDRIERVVGFFVEQLLAAGVPIPENFQRVGRCGARNDPQPCYIYRFGTRRLHMNVRESGGGRICLVVRCGGGFLDFAQFARKNGSMEQLKLAKMQRQSIQGREVMQFTSVYSNGERKIREVNSNSALRPPSRPSAHSNRSRP
jgi:hypothetical protein